MALEVVAALIIRGGRFLACQRPAHKDRGLPSGRPTRTGAFSGSL